MEKRAVCVIAAEVRRDWKKPYFGAVPYLEAMADLNHIGDSYYFDRGETVVRGFLANAGSWRGDVARRVKAELKEMLK